MCFKLVAKTKPNSYCGCKSHSVKGFSNICYLELNMKKKVILIQQYLYQYEIKFHIQSCMKLFIRINNLSKHQNEFSI